MLFGFLYIYIQYVYVYIYIINYIIKDNIFFVSFKISLKHMSKNVYVLKCIDQQSIFFYHIE